MLALTPQMRVLVACEAIDFRCGIDRLAQTCRVVLGEDPMSGAVFVFRNRKRTSVKLLVYDGQGFWLCQKRLSKGQFKHWPKEAEHKQCPLLWYELSVLLSGGNPQQVQAAPSWRSVLPAAYG